MYPNYHTQHRKKGATDGPTCSRNTLLRPSSVVVLHPHRRDHHRPDATGAPALRRRGRQWHDHCSQRRAVVVVEVTVRTVGARGRRRVRRRRALHRVAAALRTLVLGHAGEQRGDTERRLLRMPSVILTRGLKRRRRRKKKSKTTCWVSCTARRRGWTAASWRRRSWC